MFFCIDLKFQDNLNPNILYTIQTYAFKEMKRERQHPDAGWRCDPQPIHHANNNAAQ